MKKTNQWGLGFGFLLALAASACSSSPAGKRELSSEERARLHVEIANTAFHENDLPVAFEHLKKAEQENADVPEIYHTRALLYGRRKEFDLAVKEARQALKLKSDYPDASNTLGKLLIDLGKLNEAKAPLEKAARDPLYREAYKPMTNLGILFYRQGEYAKAKQYLDEAIQTAPQRSCVAYYYRGHVSLRSTRFQDAIRDYDTATKRFCTSFADAHLALGIAFEHSRQYDRARKKYLEVQERFPNTPVSEQALSKLRSLP